MLHAEDVVPFDARCRYPTGRVSNCIAAVRGQAVCCSKTVAIVYVPVNPPLHARLGAVPE